MDLVETITIRGNTIDLAGLILQVREIVESIDLEREGLGSAMVYENLETGTDISVQLVHLNTDRRNAKSKIGVHLRALLKPLGLTNHTVWSLVFDHSDKK